MKIRELGTKDFFTLSKIIRKMAIRKELQSIEVSDKSDEVQYGIQFVMILLENMDRAEDEISAFFGDLIGITAEEFKNMNLDQLAEFISELKQVKGLGSFFTSLFKMEMTK